MQNWITTHNTVAGTMIQQLSENVKVVIDYKARKIGTYIDGRVSTDTIPDRYMPEDHIRFLESVEQSVEQLNRFH